ncbi:MAG: Gfo/Idh/MocA family protein [Bacteroidota bacterium]
MKEQLGIAIVGCGLISRFHLKALRGVPEFRVKGVWDAVPEAARGLNESCGVPVYGTLRELLADPEVDVVDICLPSGLHAEYGCQAAQAGKHVIVEKPIDITMAAATRLIETCRRADVFLAEIFQYRFVPSVVKVKKAIEGNTLGRLYAGEATIKWFRDENYYRSSKWKGTKQYDGGGALINQGIHTIDLLLWFMGDVRSVTSLVRTVRHAIEVEDLAMALVEFKSGAIGTITGSTAFKPGFLERIELYGEKGAIALESGRIVRWKVDGAREEDHLDAATCFSGSADPAGISADNHQTQFKAIAAALRRGEQPPVGGAEAIRALRLITEIYAADKKWITRND